MQYTEEFIAEVAGHISRLGLTVCPICKTDASLNAWRLPVTLEVGGARHPPRDKRHDPDATTLFMVTVECNLCGHVMLFNSNRFRRGDEPIFLSDPPELGL